MIGPRPWGLAGLAAGLALAAAPVLAQTAAPALKPAFAAEEEAVAAPIVPRLTIAPETAEAPAAPRRRPPPENPWEAQGIDAGGFRLYPSLTMGAVSASNPLRCNCPTSQPALGLSLTPALRLESDWVRHELTAEARFTTSIFDDSAYDTTEGEARAALRLDIRRSTTLDLTTSYALDQASLASSDAPAGAVSYRTEHRIETGALLAHDFGRFTTRLKGAVAVNLFADVALSGGGHEDNSDRNYMAPSLALRAIYTDPPSFKPYAEVALRPRLYVETHDRNGLRRSSEGYEFRLGGEWDGGPIWQGDLAATYLRRVYDDPALGANGAIGLSGSLAWSPTELTRLVLGLETELTDSVGTASAGSRRWSARLDGSHGLRENVMLSAGLGVEFERAETGDDVSYEATAALAWTMTPTLSWALTYEFAALDAADPSRNYHDHRLGAALTLSR